MAAGSAFNAGLYKKAAVGVAVLAGATGVAWWTHSSPGPTNPATGQTANAWINPAGAGASPSVCSSPCAYDSTHAYGSMNAAYAAMSAGQTALIKAGSLGAQTINWDGTKTSTNCDGWVSQSGDVTPVTSGCITFTPETGATVTFTGSIQDYGSDLRLLNLNLGTGPSGNAVNVNTGSCVQTDVASDQPSYIIFDGIQASSFGADYTSHYALLNSTINLNASTGPLGQINGCDPDGAGAQAYGVSDHVRLQGDVFENVLESAGHHDTCIHSTDAGVNPDTVTVADYWVVSHNRFLNCAESNLEIQSGSNSPGHDVLIENNDFAAPCSEQPAGYTPPGGSVCGPIASLVLECAPVTAGYPDFHDYTVRFNSFVGAISIDSTGGGTNACSGLVNYNVYGNIMDGYTTNFSCNARVTAGVVFDYNVWEGASAVNCGTTGNVVSASSVMVDPSTTSGAIGSTTYNFHLSSCAVSAANIAAPSSITGLGAAFGYPSVDFAGTARPAGTNLDAGAYEDCS